MTKLGARWCSAPGCTQNSKKDSKMTFFRFPKQKERARIWVANSGREDLEGKDANYLYENCKLCSLHFQKNMFANFMKNRLKEDAVPTLFNLPKSVLTDETEDLQCEASGRKRKCTSVETELI
ncbi:52 kDa repressor of the inhibitor of the protein kinase-like [Nilaparvata lugens]|uniref:52 kDa repressor of the inhibitor of the protein kinase-like n=1 Tax=Nilaparvata lugens TaxID=108931 RepID=UPI00193DE89E|nr:52 kDa repressor of the inhibitor of the protein kinase-like [Nilaparvata lugens]